MTEINFSGNIFNNSGNKNPNAYIFTLSNDKGKELHISVPIKSIQSKITYQFGEAKQITLTPYAACQEDQDFYKSNFDYSDKKLNIGLGESNKDLRNALIGASRKHHKKTAPKGQRIEFG